MALQYTDCKITIHGEKSLTIEYQEHGTNRQKFDLVPDPCASITVERLHAWINFGLKQLQQKRTQDSAFDALDLQVIGLNLYRILFGNKDVETIFRRVYKNFEDTYQDEFARGNTGLRMRMLLVFEPPAESLGKLPWEFLFVPDKPDDWRKGFFFAGKKTELILTRFVPADGKLVAKFPGPKTERLRILVAIYSPVGMGGISEPELVEVLVKMREIANAEVKDVRNLSYDQLKRAVAEFGPHIFHFIGHGKDGKLSLVKVYGEDDYDEEIGQNQVRWIAGEEFKDLFSNDPKPKPLLVFLHACQGASASSEGTFVSCARALVDDIPAVVAMQHIITNEYAGIFATKFYEQLGAGCEIDEAVNAGRFALGELFPPWKHPRFATPVVYLQKSDPLVHPPPAELKAGAQDAGGTYGLGGTGIGGPRPGAAPAAPVTPAPADNRDRPEIGDKRS